MPNLDLLGQPLSKYLQEDPAQSLFFKRSFALPRGRPSTLSINLFEKLEAKFNEYAAVIGPKMGENGLVKEKI